MFSVKVKIIINRLEFMLFKFEKLMNFLRFRIMV